ncbi:MAG TPA: 2,3-diphosphoglycerate-dependent phosphoglycerate mutase, partial [Candidatus Kapabacteria bacterium]|nr:2,3-diphosphoglycerate-dependent phosphoglycerate mutase [Candidatus Kapabacteria bacterium]
MSMLALVRHGESQWNLENRFTGWIDIGLSPKGEQEARTAGELLKSYHFDCLFTSVLKRAIDTATILCQTAGFTGLETFRDQALNERHYGKLQGLNKAETAKEFGEAQVKIWRRSYDVRPPEGESLADTAARVLPYYEKTIQPLLLQGKNVLVVAHGNSLRALVMKLDALTKEQVVELNIPTAEPIIYTFNSQGA